MIENRRRRRSLSDLMKDYIDELEALSEELSDDVVGRPSWDLRSCCVEALCNVSVTPDEVVVTADLPNTNPDTIKVEPITKELLEIKAEMKRKVRFNEFGITHRQGEFQFFCCQTRIPVPVDTKRMKTQFKRGILEVHLPRKKGYRIKVE